MLEPIRQLLKVEEWKGRHTGLMALSAVISSVIEVSLWSGVRAVFNQEVDDASNLDR